MSQFSRFKGPLEKPGQRKGGGGKIPKASVRQSGGRRESLQPKGKGKPPAGRSRYASLKASIHEWWNDRLKIGDYFREIKEEKLYKGEYESFEDFCFGEFGLKHTQAYGYISAAGVRDSLKNSAMAEKVTNERQARALIKIPEEKRVEVLSRVAEEGPVTARAITAAAGAPERKSPVRRICDKCSGSGFLD